MHELIRFFPLAGWVVRRLTGKSPGQVVVMFMLVSGIAGFAGVLTLDVGFWLAERRDAQGDADAIALAGAIELPVQGVVQDAAVRQVAIDAAEDWARANGVDLGASDSYTDVDSELDLTVLWNSDDSSSDECFAGQGDSQELYTGVRATVTRTAPSIFIGLISNTANIADLTEVSVTATACTGVPTEVTDFAPFGLQMNGECFAGYPPVDDATPLLGARCVLKAGTQTGGPNFGALGFASNGTDCNDTSPQATGYRDGLSNGVSVICALGDSVGTATGNMGGPTSTGLINLIGVDEVCDAAYFSDGSLTPALLDTESATFVTAGYDALVSPTVNDKFDDFFEIWRLDPAYDPANPAEGVALRDCDPNTAGVQTSPRNLSVLVVDDVDDGDDPGADCDGSNGTCLLLRGFTTLYLEGCSTDNVDPALATIEKDFGQCTSNLGRLIIYGRLVAQIGESNLTLGYTFNGDWQTFLKE